MTNGINPALAILSTIVGLSITAGSLYLRHRAEIQRHHEEDLAAMSWDASRCEKKTLLVKDYDTGELKVVHAAAGEDCGHR